MKWMAILLALLPLAVSAQTLGLPPGTQPGTSYSVLSGSGFFVNREYVVTNAHVVTGCTRAVIKGAVREHEVEVKFVDTTHDLALLHTGEAPDEIAPLRFNIDDLKGGDRVVIVGFPGDAGARGEYKLVEAQIEDLSRKLKVDPGTFYVTDVVEHGNSGGPVFDTSGNVIGVVVAKTDFTLRNPQTNALLEERHLGVAISLSTLKQFLFERGIFAQWNSSGMLMFSNNYIEDQAKRYVVNVQCRIPVGYNPPPVQPQQEMLR